MRRRKISHSVAPIVIEKLKEKQIPYTYDQKEGYIKTNLTSKEFHRQIEEALCKLQRGKRKTEVISFDMFADGIRPRGGFVMLQKDSERFLAEVL